MRFYIVGITPDAHENPNISPGDNGVIMKGGGGVSDHNQCACEWYQWHVGEWSFSLPQEALGVKSAVFAGQKPDVARLDDEGKPKSNL